MQTPEERQLSQDTERSRDFSDRRERLILHLKRILDESKKFTFRAKTRLDAAIEQFHRK
jgi:hypothetical protein